jgi:aminopeptidase N
MKKLYVIVSALAIIAGCTNSKKSTDTAKKAETTNSTVAKNDTLEYHPSATRSIDIIHTKLEVSFDWEKQYMNGKAYITLKPYFYPTKEITLDAQSFEVKNVSLLTTPAKPLVFTYNKKQLTISLDKEYTRNDTLKIFVDYIAKPNERETKVGTAITSDKGLYFINPQGKEKDKPTQLWTQGEPESNSCWFPTFDKPNERMTQEIYITIDPAHKNFVTLSNGLLISSTGNPDGSRTDYWKQSLPSAPYLAMMAVGDFAIVKDKWKNMDVNYYVEHEYEPYAKAIFGKTPEMLEFFSNRLGTPYPWEKFSQVVVRDYVSGAMENTSAVLHGSFLNQTDREMLDNSYEDVISHELFHHWFGDYVTCEQWSNTTLNEGFATYGEYLWQEYKYGRDAADQHARESMLGYLSSAAKSEKHLIRYQYDVPDDVFDANSYNKGGAVIHMLRRYVGDDAFFAALKTYLDKYKFSSVEADNLRLVFEQTTGEDLHWFFDQWFYGLGHPKLLIEHSYNDSLKKYFVSIHQKQDLSACPLFKLPIDIDIYIDGKTERHRVWVNNADEKFSFSVAHKPDLVNVDAEKSTVCNKEEKKSITEWVFQYKNCPLYVDRLEALKECANFASVPEAANIILAALNDRSADMRERAVNMTEKLTAEYKNPIKEKLTALAKYDEKASVRSLAIEQLANNFKDDDLTALYRQAVNDRSYSVAGSSLSALAKKDEKEAMKIAKQFESEKSTDMLMAVAQIYAAHGNDQNQPFFATLSQKLTGWENVSFANNYTEFLKRCSDDTINAGIKILEKIARNEDNRWVRHFGQKGIQDLALMYTDRQQKLSVQIEKLKGKQENATELKTLEQQLVQAKSQGQKLNSLYDSVKTPN